jgi:hypothetical protein
MGLVETQRLGREAVAELRTPAPGSIKVARPATPSLADELEPSSTVPAVQRAKRQRTPWLWIIIIVLVLGGGGGAAAVMLLGKKTHDYEPVAHIDNVSITAGKQFGPVLVESDGKLAPDQIYAQYQNTIDQLLAFDAKVTAKLDVVQHIVAMPRNLLCSPMAYPGNQAPKDCATASAEATFGPKSTHVLLVSDDIAVLPAAMKIGVAQAVCVFQAPDLAPDQVDKICDMTKRFAPTDHP